MTARPCADCGDVIDNGVRCTTCTPPDAPDRTPTARGYDAAWRTLSRRARRLQPFCTDCGATDDLQADHTPAAWDRKARGLPIRLQDVDVVCGPCNRARGAARPGTHRSHERRSQAQPDGSTRGVSPRGGDRTPRGKAECAIHTPGGYA